MQYLDSIALNLLPHSSKKTQKPINQNSLIRDLEKEEYVSHLLSHLTWTHFVELLQIEEELKRSFYEIECLKNNWSTRELIRQRNSMLFERVGLSKDKDRVLQMAKEGAVVESPQDLIKSPYIFLMGIFESPSKNPDSGIPGTGKGVLLDWPAGFRPL